MQLGHGNKKEQEEPHRLFDPSNVVWKNVCCGIILCILILNAFGYCLWSFVLPYLFFSVFI